jgi:XTP/dITP diphosphohydrolase
MLKFRLKGKVIFFATGNIHKFNEARVVLSQHGLAAGMLRLKGIEIQSDNLAEIAASSALQAYRNCHLPIIVEDAGLFVDALKGFPGPYAAHVFKTIGNAGLLKLMKGAKDRKATFRSAIAYCNSETDDVFCFEGEAVGEITLQERVTNKKYAFGFDPIFQPEGSNKTFAEMDIIEKNCFSHRAKALHRFAQCYRNPDL